MANSSRDPYWQGSIRREAIDHPESSALVQDECSTCHMPMQHLIDRAEGRKTAVFSTFPLTEAHKGVREAADGVSCSVCHQITSAGLGTPKTFSGNVAVAPPSDKDNRPEYGPFVIDAGHATVMRSSTKGFVPQEGAHMRDSALCGSCHTLYTTARGPGGQAVGTLPEQMPYLEWQHSDYRDKQSCQECHMPVVKEATRVTAVYGQLREGMHRHTFVGSNFVMERMLNAHRDELGVEALPEELDASAKRTAEFLQAEAARVSLSGSRVADGCLAVEVKVENLTGHKLPTAYPSRRAWLHFQVKDETGRVVFESGALNADGSIVGNDNDADPTRFEPHYREITSPEQVEIFEPILQDAQGKVTTGLLAATSYKKDNRLLPAGFDKQTASHDIAVVGDAAEDPNFSAGSSRTRYVIPVANASGPLHVEVELRYQPIGFRWAHNLAPYQAAEPQRFVSYYESAARDSAIVLAHADAIY
jgi:hypothetical protein